MRKGSSIDLMGHGLSKLAPTIWICIAVTGAASAHTAVALAEPQPKDPSERTTTAQPEALSDDAPAANTTQIDSCVAQFIDAQEQRRKSALLAAEKSLVACAQQGCPALVRKKCVGWLAELKPQLPSIVIVLTDKDGHDLVNAQVSVDGRKLLDPLGKAVPLDPGRHLLKISLPSGETLERAVVLAVGERRRRVHVDLRPVGSKRVAAERGGDTQVSPSPQIPVLAWIGFGTSLAGIAVGAATGAVALSEGSELDDKCNPVCNESERDRFEQGRTLAHISTVSFVTAGLGLGLGIGALLWTTAPEQPKAKSIALRLTGNGAALQVQW